MKPALVPQCHLTAIYKLRLQARPTLLQRELALLVGVSQSRLSEYERGDVEAMPLATAMTIARLFGVSVEEVFLGLRESIDRKVQPVGADHPA